MGSPYAIEMLNITKRFPGIIANDNITLQLKKGEIHALLGENGAGKSTLMSVLFGLYQPEEGVIKKDGQVVSIKDPNDANALGIGMVHQHFKLVECFTVLDNIIMGVEPTKHGFLQKAEAREKVLALSEKYGLHVDPDALIEDITVGMQQRTEILKMLYRENEILIFDEPTAVLTPQEIDELMQIMRNLAAEGKSILFISHKLAEIMEVADRCSVLRKGKYIGTVETANTKLLHAKTGAAVARVRFGVPPEIENAIRWHTTGKPDMTTLEKVLYMADYIEPARDFDGVDELRRLAYTDLDAAMVLGLQMSLEDLRAGGITPHENTVQALNWYQGREKEYEKTTE